MVCSIFVITTSELFDKLQYAHVVFITGKPIYVKFDICQVTDRGSLHQAQKTKYPYIYSVLLR